MVIRAALHGPLSQCILGNRLKKANGRRTGETKANVVVAVVGGVVVALRRPQVVRIVVPRTAAIHPLAVVWAEPL